MIHKDKRTPRQIKELVERIERDSFWRTNVLSPSKLREKFDDLLLKLSPSNANGQQSLYPELKPA